MLTLSKRIGNMRREFRVDPRLRWIVDGVLLENSNPTIPFTQAHEITAVVRDARGATTTDTKLIACM